MKTALSIAVLLIAGPLLAVPDDLEDAFQNLKQAESRKDTAQLKKYARQACELARKTVSEAEPADQNEKEVWTRRVAYAHEVEVHAEYALLAAALSGPPETTVDLLSTLEQENPKSNYLEGIYGTYFIALTKAGAAAKIPAVAERALAHFPNNEDLLLVLADTAISRKQNDRASNYAERLVDVLQKHPAARGMSAADWERKRTAALGRGYWIAGVVHHEKGQFFDADKDLRAAVPLIQGNDAMLGPALFYLGVANYQLGIATRSRERVLQAAKFSDQAAAIKGPLAMQAWRNAQAMRTEAVKLR